MENADAVWQALSNPVRRQIVDLLRDGPRTTGSLADSVHASHRVDRFAVQRHLTVLRDSGLVQVTAHGRERRNALDGSVLYQATIGWLRPADAETAGRLDRLKRHLESTEPTRERTMDIQHFDVTQSIDIQAPPERVFRALVEDVADWWGAPYAIIDDPETISIEARLGGLVRENRGDHEALWGVVSEFEPGAVLAWTGSMGLGSGAHGTVTYTLTPGGSGTSLTVHHVSFGLFSSGMAEGYGYGWDDLNHRLKTLVETGEKHGLTGSNSAVAGFVHAG